MIDFYIGIDPGTDTGIGVWSRKERRLLYVVSAKILEAMEFVIDIKSRNQIELRIEDARLRTWYGESKSRDEERKKLQGVGSVKRDSAIWEEFANFHEIPYMMMHPKDLPTKLDAKTFKQITGWKGRTNEHARDAAMIVYGI